MNEPPSSLQIALPISLPSMAEFPFSDNLPLDGRYLFFDGDNKCENNSLHVLLHCLIYLRINVEESYLKSVCVIMSHQQHEENLDQNVLEGYGDYDPSNSHLVDSLKQNSDSQREESLQESSSDPLQSERHKINVFHSSSFLVHLEFLRFGQFSNTLQTQRALSPLVSHLRPLAATADHHLRPPTATTGPPPPTTTSAHRPPPPARHRRPPSSATISGRHRRSATSGNLRPATAAHHIRPPLTNHLQRPLVIASPTAIHFTLQSLYFKSNKKG
ncbi:hypothetical protein M5K25_010503 [Dendrobium thyrsiflorum]|uniref:Uncharacterized protein n=1 Tax=Dendrobium thyrsiflorum TaxID=117978 RepID=A0ABD0V7R0_DENTH